MLSHSKVATLYNLAMPIITLDSLKRDFKLSDDQLKQKCSKQHLEIVAPDVENYLEFASRLNLRKGDLKEIKTDVDLTYIQKTKAVLLWWNKNCDDATYKIFIETCLDIPDGDSAKAMSRLCASTKV